MIDRALADGIEYSETIPAQWSVGGHIDASSFLLLFDHATDAFREALGIGRRYGESCARALFVAEAHLTYTQEVRPGDAIRIRTRLLAAAARKLHVFHEMRRNSHVAIAATAELLLVHVDSSHGRAVALSPEYLERMRALVALQSAQPLPIQAGRAIRMDSPKLTGANR